MIQLLTHTNEFVYLILNSFSSGRIWWEMLILTLISWQIWAWVWDLFWFPRCTRGDNYGTSFRRNIWEAGVIAILEKQLRYYWDVNCHFSFLVCRRDAFWRSPSSLTCFVPLTFWALVDLRLKLRNSRGLWNFTWIFRANKRTESGSLSAYTCLMQLSLSCLMVSGLQCDDNEVCSESRPAGCLLKHAWLCHNLKSTFIHKSIFYIEYKGWVFFMSGGSQRVVVTKIVYKNPLQDIIGLHGVVFQI